MIKRVRATHLDQLYPAALITADLLYEGSSVPWKDLAITTEDELEEHLWFCTEHECLVLDFETRKGDGEEGVQPHKAEIIGVTVGTQGRHRYIPVIAYPTDPRLPWPVVWRFLNELGQQDHLWFAHYGTGFDWIIWKREGLPWPIRFHDTMVMASVANPHGRKSQKLLEQDLLGIHRPLYADVVGKERDLSRVPLERVAKYAVADGVGCEQLAPVLRADLQSKNLWTHYEKSKEQVHICMWMEERGMPVDPVYMRQQRDECERYILEQVGVAEKIAQEMTGDPEIRMYYGPPDDDQEDAIRQAGLDKNDISTFWQDPPLLSMHAKTRVKEKKALNIRSRDHMMDFLFVRCGLKKNYGKRIKEGVNNSMLIRMLRDGVKIAEPMKKINKGSKMLSGFYVPICETMREEKDGAWRIHTRFNAWRAATGRHSSSDPINLQNQPNYSKEFPWTAIRKGFVASPGYRLICGDLSQIELRLLAHFARDATMQEIFDNGGDIHCRTGAHLAGVSYEEFRSWEPPKDLDRSKYTKNQETYTTFRLRAKPLNYGISYLMGPPKFQLYAADNYNVWWTVEECAEAIDAWFRLFSRIGIYHKEILESLVKRGYVETILGRKAFFDRNMAAVVYAGDKGDPNYWIGHRQWRQATNQPIQGSAADLIIEAQRKAYDTYCGSDVYHLSQVHDELIFEAPEHKAKKVAAEVKEILESRQDLLAYSSSVHVGMNWMESH